MSTRTTENYLKAIYFLQTSKDAITLSDLSKVMGVSTPSVNSMVKKLKAQNFIHYEKYKPIQLTEDGKKAAALVVRKHRLTEMFLVEKMNFGWEEVHDIAEQIEHIKSPQFFERMDEMLGYPKVDPHGSPIPDKNGEIIPHFYDKLSTIAVGKMVKLAALRDSSAEFLKYLNRLQLELGSEFEVKFVESFDNSMVILFDNKELTLSNDVCERILVETF